MANFLQFEIDERFDLRHVVNLPDSLRFDKRIKEEGKLFRLLVGSVIIRNNITGETIPQNTNYSVLGKKASIRFSKRMFLEYFSSRTTLDKIDNYLTNSNPRNIPLFKDIISEYCFYFYYRDKGTHTLSFLHLYRILERLSYTFPMLYASYATDYMGTFGKLQNYFKGSNSELKFFNLFISDFFDIELLDYRVKFDITAFNADIQKKYFSILKQLCLSNDPNIDIKDQNEPTSITIENRDTLNLMIHLRNRYFHFLSGGQRNISSTELIEPNHFFGLVNEHFANWLSILYFQIIKSQMR